MSVWVRAVLTSSRTLFALSRRLMIQSAYCWRLVVNASSIFQCFRRSNWPKRCLEKWTFGRCGAWIVCCWSLKACLASNYCCLPCLGLPAHCLVLVMVHRVWKCFTTAALCFRGMTLVVAFGLAVEGRSCRGHECEWLSVLVYHSEVRG